MVNKGVIIGIILIVAITIITIFNPNLTGKTVSDENVQQIVVVPLSPEERAKAEQLLLSSDFIKDVPKKGVISLRFFTIENGQITWRDEFLIGKNKLLSSGTPDIYLILNTIYISESSEGNLCETIKKAINNGDLKFESKISKAKLLIKYIGMLKHRECFGVEF